MKLDISMALELFAMIVQIMKSQQINDLMLNLIDSMVHAYS